MNVKITVTVTCCDCRKCGRERVFINTYKAASTSATIKAKKVLNGKDLVADAYTFELKEKDAVVATAKNAASGEVVFKVDYTKRRYTTITEKRRYDEKV